jgi:hypothetical protein
MEKHTNNTKITLKQITYTECLIQQGQRLLTSIGALTVGAQIGYLINNYLDRPAPTLHFPPYSVFIFCLTHLLVGAYWQYHSNKNLH